MLNRHKDELSLEWDKRWEHLQLGKEIVLFCESCSRLRLASHACVLSGYSARGHAICT